MTLLRADMHVHTCFSRYNGDLPFLGSRDCYSKPESVYRVAKARGMDLVAITDHDTIDGALDLLQRIPDARDVIVGEEITCWLPDGGLEVHLGAYGMTEALHREIQPIRRNVFDVIDRLRESSALVVLNHLLHFYRPRTSFDAYLRLLDAVPAIEVRNGTMLAGHNRLAERIASDWGRVRVGRRIAAVAGSDAHTLRRVGTTWTEAPGGDREAFLASVAEGLGRPGGRDGGALTVTGDACGVIRNYAGSLIGLLPRDHHGWRRAGCLAFVVGSLPFQFMPLVVASQGKLRERRHVRALEAWMTRNFGAETTRAAVSAAQPE